MSPRFNTGGDLEDRTAFTLNFPWAPTVAESLLGDRQRRDTPCRRSRVRVLNTCLYPGIRADLADHAEAEIG